MGNRFQRRQPIAIDPGTMEPALNNPEVIIDALRRLVSGRPEDVLPPLARRNHLGRST